MIIKQATPQITSMLNQNSTGGLAPYVIMACATGGY